MRIGYYKFNTEIELHVVNAMGDTRLLNDKSDQVEIEVECVLHCDDPEDGVYAEEISARIVDENIFELGEDAIDLLDLSVKAGEVFQDGGMVPPKKGEKYMDSDGYVWTVAGSGKLEDHASFYIWLERGRNLVSSLNSNPTIGRTIEDHVLHSTHVNDQGELEPCYQRIIDKPLPPEDQWHEPGIYLCQKCKRPLHPLHHLEGKPCL